MRENYTDFSELEREFELEMEGAMDQGLEVQFEGSSQDQEFEFEQDFELEQDEELLNEYDPSFEQDEGDREYEAFDDGRSQEFVERFLEIGSRQFETPYEVDEAMGEVLDDIEREYFFGAIKRGLKKLSNNKLLRSLAKKGLSMGVNKFFPGLQGALQLARGNVKGALLNFGKQALGSVVPGGSAMIDAVKAIGIQPGAGAEERETWENYVQLSREAYEHLAENLTPRADQPAEAMRLANNAVQHAIAGAKARTVGAQGPARRGRGGGRVIRLRVSPGERIKLLVMGA